MHAVPVGQDVFQGVDPSRPAVVGIQAAEAVDAFDHQHAAVVERCRSLGVAVGDFQGAVAIPGGFEGTANQRVVRAKRVGGVGVLVGPQAGSRQGAAPLDLEVPGVS